MRHGAAGIVVTELTSSSLHCTIWHCVSHYANAYTVSWLVKNNVDVAAAAPCEVDCSTLPHSPRLPRHRSLVLTSVKEGSVNLPLSWNWRALWQGKASSISSGSRCSTDCPLRLVDAEIKAAHRDDFVVHSRMVALLQLPARMRSNLPKPPVPDFHAAQ